MKLRPRLTGARNSPIPALLGIDSHLSSSYIAAILGYMAMLNELYVKFYGRGALLSTLYVLSHFCVKDPGWLSWYGGWGRAGERSWF
jgi:hypothetical protein